MLKQLSITLDTSDPLQAQLLVEYLASDDRVRFGRCCLLLGYLAATGHAGAAATGSGYGHKEGFGGQTAGAASHGSAGAAQAGLHAGGLQGPGSGTEPGSPEPISTPVPASIVGKGLFGFD